MQQGEMAVCSKRNIFQLSAKMYVTFLQRKWGDYEIMQALHIFARKSAIYEVKVGYIWKKCGPCVNMQTLADYALN